MKKQLIISIIGILLLISLSIIIKPSSSGEVVSGEEIRLGYCPTMQEEALLLSEENSYELVQFGSASEVLSALKNNEIEKALIGRKAEESEINHDVRETILKSGYTLVSDKKDFVDYSLLSSMEIYTYLDLSLNFPVLKISKEEVLEKVQQGKTVLISWEDWDDDFELIVVMSDNEKVKEFRGVFLYGG